MSINAVKNLQFYPKSVEVEHERETLLVTLTEVDLSELVGQVSLDDLLDNHDLDAVVDYVDRRRKEDSE